MATNNLRAKVPIEGGTLGAITTATLQVVGPRDIDDVLPTSLVADQFPGFIQDEYPRMVEFAQAYFDFLARETENGKIQDIRDLDKTTGNYINALRGEYSYNSMKFNFLDDREFIRVASKFYSTKGSEEAIKFLFRVMFNEEVDIEYPSEDIFKASSAQWVQEQSVKVVTIDNSVPATDFIGDYLTIRNSENETQLIYINSVEIIDAETGEYEVIFSTEINIQVDIGDVLIGENFRAQIVPSLIGAIPLVPGQKFKVGQIINFETAIGSGGVGMVSKIDKNGGIEHLRMLKFGSAYMSNFYLSVQPSGIFTETAGSYLTTGRADINIVATDVTDGFLEAGEIYLSDYVANDSPGPSTNYVYPGHFGSFATGWQIRQVFVADEDFSALLLSEVGAVAKYPGKHLDVTGFPSNSSVLQDNNVYQNFSYIIRTEQNIKEYRDIVTSIGHPAGIKMFGMRSTLEIFDADGGIDGSTVEISSFVNANSVASASAYLSTGPTATIFSSMTASGTL